LGGWFLANTRFVVKNCSSRFSIAEPLFYVVFIIMNKHFENDEDRVG
jgi:hypothetical protein